MTCTCNNQACKVRMARGLAPFCQMPAPTARPVGFATYREAAQNANGGRVRSVGGILKGCPKRFVVEA